MQNCDRRIEVLESTHDEVDSGASVFVSQFYILVGMNSQRKLDLHSIVDVYMMVYTKQQALVLVDQYCIFLSKKRMDNDTTKPIVWEPT